MPWCTRTITGHYLKFWGDRRIDRKTDICKTIATNLSMRGKKRYKPTNQKIVTLTPLYSLEKVWKGLSWGRNKNGVLRNAKNSKIYPLKMSSSNVVICQGIPENPYLICIAFQTLSDDGFYVHRGHFVWVLCYKVT